jgi:hypothetical protein
VWGEGEEVEQGRRIDVGDVEESVGGGKLAFGSGM